ncbi:SRPBCC family protein [Phenylobacterium sp.]|uniref:SRPBCC family protein n=1 Tax=Phenylobacterium sp. TaxID=1871053 RepID=UPI002811AFA8|nr:SRPBCC family protein [Phenylobacterium sp.]
MPKPVEVSTPTDREVVVTREFHAPRQLVWDAYTKAELVQRWLLGPPGTTMPYCQVDLRVGGRYRYVWRAEDGSFQFGAFGEHLEVSAPERLVTSEWMDGLDGQPMDFENPKASGEPSINTLTLVERNGRTALTIRMLFPSKEIRDMAVQSGMTDGMAQSYDRLEQVLEGVG